MLQLYLGMTSGDVMGYPMRSEKQVGRTFEDAIRRNGAPIGLISDNAKAEMYAQVEDLKRLYKIDDGQSEPEYQHQNPAERKIQDVKKMANSMMDRTGCPAQYWLLATLLTIALFRIIPNANGDIPYTVSTGQVPDISKFTVFHFWQEVFVEKHGSKSHEEELARWCYPAEHCGDEMTHMVLLEKTQQLVARSNVRPARDPLYPNLRQRPRTDDLRPPARPSPKVKTVHEESPHEFPDQSGTSGEPQNPEWKPICNLQDKFDAPALLPKFSPEELVGLTHLHSLEDGQVVRAKVMRKVLEPVETISLVSNGNYGM